MANVSSLPYVEGSSTNRPPLFDGSNYTFWKSRIKIYICSINFNLWSIVEKGPYVPIKDGIIKEIEDYDELDSRKMTLNFQAMNILSCALDANEYNRVSGCDSAHEMWKLLEVTHESTNHLVADCPKALKKEKEALEVKLEALKKKKKGKGLIGTWDQDSSDNEEEESANICFMALENEVQSSPSNSSNLIDDICDDDPCSMFPKETKS
ncbi:hypothetical protein M9H77_35333 [Catharanthus roseus]|uniref:Uncharacterized protein n=1 Tax=Catharanthus roseus TaxID=4058 RepID=A0ACB9ZQL6_CATRO|nr:hypothetical protein M9H77_35333 [Catharanthus roseus]